jgi:F0F1-type ATP synthase assembly protein I
MGLQLGRLLCLQAAIGLCCALIAGLAGDLQSAQSAVLGAMAGSVGAVAFVAVHGALGLFGAKEKARSAFSAYVVAELSRIGSTIVLLAVTLPAIEAEHAGAYLATFVATLMAYTLLLLF